MTSQGAFTLGSWLSPGRMATVQKWAPGRGAAQLSRQQQTQNRAAAQQQLSQLRCA